MASSLNFLHGDDPEPKSHFACSWLRVKSAINLWVRPSQIGRLKEFASLMTSMAWAGLLDALALSINSFSNSFL